MERSEIRDALPHSAALHAGYAQKDGVPDAKTGDVGPVARIARGACRGLAQQPNNVVLHEGSTKQLTPHVWAIFGNPNIAIIVGSKATLVVDTGLGPRNGAFIAGEVSKLRKSAKLFLTTTHAHTEHSSGQGGFPADTVVIRPKAQQQELDETGASGIENFRSRNDTNRRIARRCPRRQVRCAVR